MARRVFVILGAAALGVVVFVAAVLVTVRPDFFRGAGSGPQCRAAAEMAEAVAPYARGAMAPFQTIAPADVTALPYDGRGEDAATLGALKGRTILLNLWATWCAPCRIEMPSLAALEAEKGSDAFAVVAVSVDNRDANRPEDFLAETNAEALDYHREPTMRLFNSLNAAGLASGMPATLLLAPDGCAAGVLNGAAEWDGKDAKALIDAALASVR